MKAGQWLVVDDLEWPGPNPQGHVGTVELGAQVNETSQTDVGERAGDVGEHLDHGHRCASDRSGAGVSVASG
jgi:hypothetical protein